MDNIEATALYGVDGAKDGWVVARSSPDLRDVSLSIEHDLDHLFARVIGEEAMLAIDIPIGLPDTQPRQCDLVARRRLGQPRGSSVFPAPMRAAFAARSYSEACDLNEQASGRRLSLQSYHILPKIHAVDLLMSPEHQSRIIEAHPEVTFMMLNGAAHGLSTNKKRTNGKEERGRLLAGFLPSVDPNALRRSVRPVNVPLDDIHDALACLVTARRVVNREATRLPEDQTERDSRGLRMEIVA